MKLTKDDWFKIASPVVLIVVGILLACYTATSLQSALDIIIGIALIIIGAVYLSLAFIIRKNVLHPYSIFGLALMGLGTAELVQKELIKTLFQWLAKGIGWAFFFFGIIGTVLAIIYLCMNRNVKFYAIELAIALVCGLIGGLLVFPIPEGIITSPYDWLVIGIVFTIVGIIWLIFTVIWFNNKEARARKAAASRR